MRDGHYRVPIALAEASKRQQMSLCSILILGAPSALRHGVLDNAKSVLIRESGFQGFGPARQCPCGMTSAGFGHMTESSG